MSNHDDGGAAFPSGKSEQRGFENSHPLHEGMTLADYFAAKAMAAMIANPHYNGDIPVAKTARLAYYTADVMIAERNRRAG